jgi:hypothetical protein
LHSPHALIAAWSSSYLVSFRRAAASIPSSAGQVSSIIITFLDNEDQMTMSGREVVAQMEGGKTILAVS